MNKKEALTQLEIMATNATGRLGEAKSEGEKALLNKHIEALNMGIDAIRRTNSLILISSGTVEEPKDIHEYPMNKEDMEALIEDINPKEIASHIETNTLGDWCKILGNEMLRTLNKMKRSKE